VGEAGILAGEAKDLGFDLGWGHEGKFTGMKRIGGKKSEKSPDTRMCLKLRRHNQ